MAQTLQSDLLRIASELPKGDPTRVRILEALDKEAGRGEILDQLLDRKAFFKLYKEMSDLGDEASSKLLREVYHKLADALSLDSGESQALNRLKQSVDNTGRWGADLQRNNIFKAANLLGIKLPHAMF